MTTRTSPAIFEFLSDTDHRVKINEKIYWQDCKKLLKPKFFPTISQVILDIIIINTDFHFQKIFNII